MRKSIGSFLMLLGAALVIAALLLFFANRREDAEAGSVAESLLPGVIAEIERRNAELTEPALETVMPAPEGEESGDATEMVTPAPTRTPPRYVDPYDTEMTETVIGDYSYIGYLSIPDLGLELPVMSQWSYPRLRVAPCRYSGSTRTDDLVILAHNYARHFGRLRRLSPGDAIIFTDMNGAVTRYRVVELEEMSPYAVADMTSGEYDLTLFTCTYGGRTRFAIRADGGAVIQ